MNSDKTPRVTPTATNDEGKAPPVDRDQSPYSAPVAHDVADKAEVSKTTGAQKKPEADESLIGRDNMKGGPARSGST